MVTDKTMFFRRWIWKVIKLKIFERSIIPCSFKIFYPCWALSAENLLQLKVVTSESVDLGLKWLQDQFPSVKLIMEKYSVKFGFCESIFWQINNLAAD